ncbi:MAG: Tryptophan-tRNA ligase [Candidatus Moranbacteria bacterium GW2011_GWC2_45_10]|nr:MAG: Tryptophan-tRNA ligase [Candidatus Moranbacteria bacterium GW2011_GWC2_45_10]
MMKKRIFSGVQPSGNLHIGNYLGAIKNWVELQDEYESIFCVVDLHAITVAQDPQELRRKTLEIAKIYLAAGIDPKKSTIFIQSQVSEHSELAWILNTITGMSELRKMTQFKDKGGDANENVGVGLFDYPVLMAADILLYDTEVVPVGEDQKQHVELARDLAKRFNHKFGETFIVPKVFIREEGMRVMGLDNPEKKMSKSAESAYNRIELLDDAETIRKKIKKAVTDSGSEIEYSDGKPALKNLINIYASFSGKTAKEIVGMYKGKGYGDFKAELAEVVIGFLEPFQQRFNALSDEEVLGILRDGAEKVGGVAWKKLHQVKEKVGFIV